MSNVLRREKKVRDNRILTKVGATGLFSLVAYDHGILRSESILSTFTSAPSTTNLATSKPSNQLQVEASIDRNRGPVYNLGSRLFVTNST